MTKFYSLFISLMLCGFTLNAQLTKEALGSAQKNYQNLDLSKSNVQSGLDTTKSPSGPRQMNEDFPTITASYGKGISIRPADKSFSMKLNFRIQSLAMYEKTIGNTEGGVASLMIRRSRVKAGGYILDPSFTYKVELGLTNRDIESTQRGDDTDNPGPILDMVLRWNFAGNWVLGFGQTKLPGNRERIVSSANLQFVDRSIVNSKFTTDRDAGFWLSHATKGDFVVRNTFALTSGEGKNRNIAKNPNTKDGGLSYSYRLEALPFGLFNKKGEYFQGDLARESKPKLAIGAAYNFNNNTTRSQGQLGSYFLSDELRDIHTGFIDYVFKYRGFSLTGEYAIKHANDPITTDSEELTAKPVYVFKGYGVSSQTSYVFKNNIELAARYSILRPHEDILSVRKNQRDLTFGISKYILGHKLKVQADVTHSAYGDEDTVVGRFQVEAQF